MAERYVSWHMSIKFDDDDACKSCNSPLQSTTLDVNKEWQRTKCNWMTDRSVFAQHANRFLKNNHQHTIWPHTVRLSGFEVKHRWRPDSIDLTTSLTHALVPAVYNVLVASNDLIRVKCVNLSHAELGFTLFSQPWHIVSPSSYRYI